MLSTPTKVPTKIQPEFAHHARRREQNPLTLGKDVYSGRSSRCVWEKVTDEVDESEIYGALPLSYGAAIKIATVGLEPTTPGS